MDVARHAARASRDHGLLVARLRQPRRWRPASACSPSAGSCSAWARAAASRRRRAPSPNGSRRRALDGDGHHQRRHRGRRRHRAAADRAGHHRRLDWRWVFFVTGASASLWTVWWWRYYPPDAASAARRRPNATSWPRCIAADAARSAAPPWLALLQLRAGLGPRRREVPERRGLVFLPVLAAEVSLRRARLRHQGGRLLRVDSVRRGRRRLPARRLALELVAAARPRR